MIKIELPAEAWNLVLLALGERPFKETAGLITEIQRQAQPQLPAAPAEEPVAEAAE
jgi:hypothetical protein